jgi:curved DNA-binding protein CbpA/outer membrane protein assembly factor BamE (lipoprotein component of BamABCDE complex)
MALHVLELEPDASDEEIKAAYRMLVKVWHPDRFEGDRKLTKAAGEKLKGINAAFKLVSSLPRPVAGRKPQTPEPKESTKKAQPTTERPGPFAEQDGANRPRDNSRPPPDPPSAKPKSADSSNIPEPKSSSGLGQFLRLVGLMAAVSIVRYFWPSGETTPYIENQVARRSVEKSLASSSQPSETAAEKRVVDEANIAASPLVARQRAQQASIRTLGDAIAFNPKIAQNFPGFAEAYKSGDYNAQPTRELQSVAVKGYIVRLTTNPTFRGLTKAEQNFVTKTFYDRSVSPLLQAEGINPPKYEIWAGIIEQSTENPADEQAKPKVRSARDRSPNESQPASKNVLPYFTVGSTREEVLSIQGTPTAFAQNTFKYGYSEVYFKDGRVVAWENVPDLNPLRVKLSQSSAVRPHLKYFTVGSTKDEVLAVQGTPTAFSQDTFKYGYSEVYFKDGRVVSWENEPSLNPLRVKLR